MKVLLNSFHLSGHTLGFHPQINSFHFNISSAQSIVVLVTSHVMYGAVLKTELKSRMNTVPTNINPDQSALVTRNVAAVNGRSASGVR